MKQKERDGIWYKRCIWYKKGGKVGSKDISGEWKYLLKGGKLSWVN